MLKSLHIEGFRCFDKFEMSDLGRVNLLTGYNNGGKTTILEAIEALHSSGRLDWLFGTIARRGEYVESDDDSREDYDLSHFFHGHAVELGSRLSLVGHTTGGLVRFTTTIDAPDENTLFRIERQARGGSRLGRAFSAETRWESDIQQPVRVLLPVLDSRVSRQWLRMYPGSESTDVLREPVRFLSTSSFAPSRIVSWFERVVLTPEEELLVEALQIVDMDIEKIAAITSRRRASSAERRDFVVKYAGVGRPLPIGTLGDGAWRILCIALGLSTASGGVLLIDEIDTGLHYATLAKMWSFVFRAAKRLNVQVFATTHSSDCIKSLATVADEAKNDGPDAITIQHIDCSKKKSVGFDRRGVVVVAERGIEVR